MKIKIRTESILDNPWLDFTLSPEKIVPKGRPRFTKQGRTYTPSRTKQAQLEILMAFYDAINACSININEVKDYPVELQIGLTWESPKSDKKRQGNPMTMKPDLDNVIKLVADALNAEAWADDSQIISMQGWKNPWRKHGTGNEIYIHIEWLKDLTI